MTQPSSDGTTAIGLVCDTADERSVRDAATGTIETFGRIDGLITVAGVRQRATLALDVDMDLRGTARVRRECLIGGPSSVWVPPFRRAFEE